MTQRETTDRLLTRAEVERVVGLKRSALYRAMREGRFPEPLRIGTKECPLAAVRSRAVDRRLAAELALQSLARKSTPNPRP